MVVGGAELIWFRLDYKTALVLIGHEERLSSDSESNDTDV
jgi:hypothetical protein